MFQVRWRWNLTRSLAVLRQQGGKSVPPHMLRFRSDDLLAAVFPETVGCLENHHGDVEIPDHPLVRQTMHDCLHEAMDIDALVDVLQQVRDGQIEFVGRDTREPSPFSYELLNASPYAFLDGAPLEERRMRAVATRRTLSPEDVRDLARLDPDAVAQVRSEAWPLVRSAEELHDALVNLVAIDPREGEPWAGWMPALVAAGRATRLTRQRRAGAVDRGGELAGRACGVSRGAGRAGRFAAGGTRAPGRADRRRRGDRAAGAWNTVDRPRPTTSPRSLAWTRRWYPPPSKRWKLAVRCCAATSTREPARTPTATGNPRPGATGGCWPGSTG